MEKLRQTPSQTIGPYFAYSLTARQYGYPFNSIINNFLLSNKSKEKQILLSGSVYDGNEKPVTDAMIELWQSNNEGIYFSNTIELNDHKFTGFGRAGTGVDLFPHFHFITTKPGRTENQSPHINVILFMRGSLHTLHTRIYFSDEINDTDQVWQMVDPERRKTLLADSEIVNGVTHYHFNIHMQGDAETVFFDIHK